MAITVKDIQEKEFDKQATGGYNVDQVDDFLDAIAAQMAAVLQENISVKEQVNQLSAELASSKKALEDTLAAKPDYNEEGYFQNFQKALRESLISVQRVADEAVGGAKAHADKLRADAQAEVEALTTKAKSEAEALTAKAKEEADRLTADSQKAVEDAKAETEKLRTTMESYRANFKKLVEEHMSVLKSTENQN